MADKPTKHVIIEIDESGGQPKFHIKKQLIGERKMDVGYGRTCATVEESAKVTAEMINQWLATTKLQLL